VFECQTISEENPKTKTRIIQTLSSTSLQIPGHSRP
jgi:hypothetical protein